MIRRLVVYITIVILTSSAILAEDTFHSLLRFDANADGRLSESELTAYFTEKKAADPADSAVDILTAFACNDCKSISIRDAATILAKVSAKPAEKEKPAPSCTLFTIKRTVSDDPNPRAPESEFPAVISYIRDKHADDTNQLNFLGAVAPVDCAWNGGDEKLFNITYGFGFGIDADVDGSKKPSDNKIEGSLPLFWRWVSVDPAAALTGLGVTITPKFSTDRALDREVWDTAVKVSFRSHTLLRAGLLSNVGPPVQPVLSLWWQPVLQYEVGNVRDPAGNEDLAKLEGSYARLAPRLDVILWPRFLSDRVALKANITERFNVAGGRRSYFEGTATYDIASTGTLQLTAIYRHGRKPPAFSPKDQWVIGIGIQR